MFGTTIDSEGTIFIMIKMVEGSTIERVRDQGRDTIKMMRLEYDLVNLEFYLGDQKQT